MSRDSILRRLGSADQTDPAAYNYWGPGVGIENTRAIRYWLSTHATGSPQGLSVATIDTPLLSHG
jgi:hypothetical protein